MTKMMMMMNSQKLCGTVRSKIAFYRLTFVFVDVDVFVDTVRSTAITFLRNRR